MPTLRSVLAASIATTVFLCAFVVAISLEFAYSIPMFDSVHVTLVNYLKYWPIVCTITVVTAAPAARFRKRGDPMAAITPMLAGAGIGLVLAPFGWASMWSEALESCVILVDGIVSGALAGFCFWVIDHALLTPIRHK